MCVWCECVCVFLWVREREWVRGRETQGQRHDRQGQRVMTDKDRDMTDKDRDMTDTQTLSVTDTSTET